MNENKAVEELDCYERLVQWREKAKAAWKVNPWRIAAVKYRTEQRRKKAAEQKKLFAERGFGVVPTIRYLKFHSKRINKHRIDLEAALSRREGTINEVNEWVLVQPAAYEAWLWVLHQRVDGKTRPDSHTVLADYYRQRGYKAPRNSANATIRQLEEKGLWWRGKIGRKLVSIPIPTLCKHFEPDIDAENAVMRDMKVPFSPLMLANRRAVRCQDTRNIRCGGDNGDATYLMQLYVEHRQVFDPDWKPNTKERQAILEAAANLRQKEIHRGHWKDYMTFAATSVRSWHGDVWVSPFGLTGKILDAFLLACGGKQPIDLPFLVRTALTDMEQRGCFADMDGSEQRKVEDEVANTIADLALEEDPSNIDENSKILALARPSIERAWARSRDRHGFWLVNYYWRYQLNHGAEIADPGFLINLEKMRSFYKEKRNNRSRIERLLDVRENSPNQSFWPFSLDRNKGLLEQFGL